MGIRFSSRATPLLWHTPGRNISTLIVIIATAIFSWFSQSRTVFIDNPGESAAAILVPVLVVLFTWLSLVRFIPDRLDSFFNDTTWTIGRDFFYNLSCFALTFIVFCYFFCTPEKEVTGFIPAGLFYFVLTSGILFTFGMQFYTYGVNRKFANFVGQRMRQRKRLNPDDILVKIPAKGEFKGFECKADQLLYVRALEGKSELHCFISGDKKSLILNHDMKAMRKLLGSITSFYRCHRLFIVNLDKVNSIEGDAAGILIKTDHSDVEIPVSSALKEELKLRLLK